MLDGLKALRHRGTEERTAAPHDEPTSGANRRPTAEQHSTHTWSLHVLEERRLKKRDECLRDLAQLEAELLHEVEREP